MKDFIQGVAVVFIIAIAGRNFHPAFYKFQSGALFFFWSFIFSF